MAILKQYIGNIRLMYNVGQMIVTIEELVVIKTGYRDRCIDFIPECQYWKKMQIDNVNEYLKSYDLSIMNLHNSYSIINQNKIIIDYVWEYVEQKQLKKNILYKINKVRRAKGLYFLFELVGFDRG